MVSLLKSLLGKAVPTFWPINRRSSLKCHLQVTTFNSEIKASVFVLHKVKGDLYIPVIVSAKNHLYGNVELTSGKPFCCKYAMML